MVCEVAIGALRNPEWGEYVIAFVVARGRAVVTVSELDQLCLEHIARFKRPKEYRMVSELPKNNYGKILKTVLREKAGKQP